MELGGEEDLEFFTARGEHRRKNIDLAAGEDGSLAARSVDHRCGPAFSSAVEDPSQGPSDCGGGIVAVGELHDSDSERADGSLAVDGPQAVGRVHDADLCEQPRDSLECAGHLHPWLLLGSWRQ
ncbi:hypothetical protein AB0D59_37495 [Streptomyces sp. NPDC048417]|uniref:hypothetical protein n=1 Tax=Streptomyces sp. NPDC048417 TaxID=3155387 RepID=UPI00343700FF